MARFRVVGSTLIVLEGLGGEELLRSLPLPTALACRATILAVRLNALLDARYHRIDDPPRGFAFTLGEPRGTVLGTSPIYATEALREQAIATVRRDAPGAYVMHSPPADDSDIADASASSPGDPAKREPKKGPQPQ